MDVNHWTPLVSDLWPNHGDYAHLCRIDNHDLIIHLGELVGLRFWVGGEDVIRERVKVGDRRHLRPDITGEPTGGDFPRAFVHFLINRIALCGR